MTQGEMYDFASKLFDCSKYMKEINQDLSDALLEMAKEMTDRLENAVMPEDIKQEIEEIKGELGD